MDYKKLYHLMFNAATDAIRLLDNKDIERAHEKLADAQCETEKMYINSSEER